MGVASVLTRDRSSTSVLKKVVSRRNVNRSRIRSGQDNANKKRSSLYVTLLSRLASSSHPDPNGESRLHSVLARLKTTDTKDMHALLIVDLQNDFCPGGALAVPEGDIIVPTVNQLLGNFDHVLMTQDWHPEGHQSFASSHPDHDPYDVIEVDYGEQVLWPDHCVQGTEGAEFHPELDTTHSELIIRKGFRPEIDSYSAFYENDGETPTGLAGYLRERSIDTLYLCGLAARCVLARNFKQNEGLRPIGTGTLPVNGEPN